MSELLILGVVSLVIFGAIVVAVVAMVFGRGLTFKSSPDGAVHLEVEADKLERKS
jgi:hypothetical protein